MPDELSSTLGLILPVVVLFAVFYFLVLRPEKKRQQKVLSMQSQLKKNDKIVTIGGMHGIIDDIKDDVITIVVASGAKMKFEKGAIKRVISDQQ